MGYDSYATGEEGPFYWLRDLTRDILNWPKTNRGCADTGCPKKMTFFTKTYLSENGLWLLRNRRNRSILLAQGPHKGHTEWTQDQPRMRRYRLSQKMTFFTKTYLSKNELWLLCNRRNRSILLAQVKQTFVKFAICGFYRSFNHKEENVKSIMKTRILHCIYLTKNLFGTILKRLCKMHLSWC